MDQRQFMHYIREVLPHAGLGRLSVPIGTPADASEVTFRRFGIDNPGDSFSKGWQFTIRTDSPARALKAFQTGSISFRPSNAANGTPNALVLLGMDAVGTLLRSEMTPSWFPIPKFITYEGVDEPSSRIVLHDYLTAEPKTFQALLKYLDRIMTIEECLNEFFAGNLSTGIPVAAGQIFGVAQQHSSLNRLVTVYMQTQKGLDEDLYLDPAVYHRHWESFFTDLTAHPLKENLTSIRFGIISNGIVRYIRSDGVDTGPFTDSNSPGHLPSLVIDEADPYDTILFLDSSTYQEDDEIVVDKPISISSISSDDVLENSTPNLPILDGGNEHRLIRVGGPLSLVDPENEEEIVSISNLIITGGLRDAQLWSDEPGFDFRASYGGAGISIHRYNQVYVRNCYFHHNLATTSHDPIAEWSEAHEESILENGFGGGILVFYSSPFIYRNRITNNQTERRGGGIGVWGYSWPHIVDNLIAQNSAYGTGAAKGDGGGVAVETAVPSRLTLIAGAVNIRPDWAWFNDDLARAKSNKIRFIGNQIIENSAADDGGGLYLTCLTRASLEENLIQSNRAGSGGGGVRASFGSEIFFRGDVFVDNETNFNLGTATNGGGAIAARSSSLHLIDVTVESNTAWGFAGGGILFTSTEEGSPFPNPDPVSTTFDDILRDVFQPLEFILALEGSTRVSENLSTMIVQDRRKGGGIYIMRYQGPDSRGEFFLGLPLRVIIEDITLVINNHLPGPVEPPASQDSVQIHIEDFVHRPGDPVNDVNKTEFLTGNSLDYESL